MKSKKLISFLCAAAMTVSSFAGLAVTTASAAAGDKIAEQNFESVTAAWTASRNDNKMHATVAADAQTAYDYFKTTSGVEFGEAQTKPTVTAPSVVGTKSLWIATKQGEGVKSTYTINPTVKMPTSKVVKAEFDVVLVSADYTDPKRGQGDRLYTIGLGSDVTSGEAFKLAVTDDNLGYYNGSTVVDTEYDLTTAGTWFHVATTMDFTAKTYFATLTPYNETSLDTANAIEIPVVAFANSTAANVDKLCVDAVRNSNGNKGAVFSGFDNFVFTEGAQKEYGTVTINYVDDQNKALKTAKTVSVEVGTSYKVDDTEKASFMLDGDGDNYYEYTATGSTDTVASVTKAGPNTITLKFAKKATIPVTFRAVDVAGNVLSTIGTEKGIPGSKVSTFKYAYVEKDGVYYEAKDLNTFKLNATVDAAASNFDVQYKKAPDVQFYKEGEAYEGATVFADTKGGEWSGGATAHSASASNYSQGFLTDPVEEEGTYEITVSTHSRKRGVAIGKVAPQGDGTFDTKYAELLDAYPGEAGRHTKAYTLAAGEAFFVGVNSENMNLTTSDGERKKDIDDLDYIVVKDTSIAASVDPKATLAYDKASRKATATVSNWTEVGDDVKAQLIVACYTGKTLKDVKTYPMNIEYNTTGEVTIPQDVKLHKDDKLMLWDSLGGVKPIAPAVTISADQADETAPTTAKVTYTGDNVKSVTVGGTTIPAGATGAEVAAGTGKAVVITAADGYKVTAVTGITTTTQLPAAVVNGTVDITAGTPVAITITTKQDEVTPPTTVEVEEFNQTDATALFADGAKWSLSAGNGEGVIENKRLRLTAKKSGNDNKANIYATYMISSVDDAPAAYTVEFDYTTTSEGKSTDSDAGSVIYLQSAADAATANGWTNVFTNKKGISVDNTATVLNTVDKNAIYHVKLDVTNNDGTNPTITATVTSTDTTGTPVTVANGANYTAGGKLNAITFRPGKEITDTIDNFVVYTAADADAVSTFNSEKRHTVTVDDAIKSYVSTNALAMGVTEGTPVTVTKNATAIGDGTLTITAPTLDFGSGDTATLTMGAANVTITGTYAEAPAPAEEPTVEAGKFVDNATVGGFAATKGTKAAGTDATVEETTYTLTTTANIPWADNGQGEGNWAGIVIKPPTGKKFAKALESKNELTNANQLVAVANNNDVNNQKGELFGSYAKVNETNTWYVYVQLEDDETIYGYKVDATGLAGKLDAKPVVPEDPKPTISAGQPSGEAPTKNDLQVATAKTEGCTETYDFTIEGLKPSRKGGAPDGTLAYWAGVIVDAGPSHTITGIDWSPTKDATHTTYSHEPGEQTSSYWFDASKTETIYLYVQLDSKYNYVYHVKVNATVVVDDPTVGNGSSDTYTATAGAYANGSQGIYKTATVTVSPVAGKNVPWSKNGAGTWGNWVGFTVAVGDGYEITGVAKNTTATIPGGYGVPGDTDTDSGDTKSKVGYYVDASKAVADPYFFVKVKNLADNTEKVYCYTIDVSGVTNKEAQPASNNAGGAKVGDTEKNAFNTGFGKALDDLVGSDYNVTYDAATKTVNVVGTLNYVEGFTYVASGEDANGNFIPWKITGLSDKAVVYMETSKTPGQHDEASVDIVSAQNIPGYVEDAATKDKSYKVYKSDFFDGDKTYMLFVTKYKGESGSLDTTFYVDADGDGGEYAPTLYKMHYEGTAKGKGETGNSQATFAQLAQGIGSKGDLGTYTYNLSAEPYSITGTANYVTNYTAFSNAAAEQNGNYLPVRVSIPNAEADGVADDALSNVTVEYWSDHVGSQHKTYDKFNSDDRNCDITYILYPDTTKLYIKVDFDGKAEQSTYSAKTYTIDVSKITKKSPAPAPTGEQQQAAKADIDNTLKQFAGGADKAPDLGEVKYNSAVTAESGVPVTTYTAQADGSELKYVELPGFSASDASEQAGYYAAYTIAYPADFNKTTGKIAVKRAADVAGLSADGYLKILNASEDGVLSMISCLNTNKAFEYDFYNVSPVAAASLNAPENGTLIAKVIYDFGTNTIAQGAKPTKLTAIEGDNTTITTEEAKVHRVPAGHNFGNPAENKKTEDFGTYNSTVENGVLKVTGTVKYVDFTGTAKDGYRVPIRVTVPEDYKGKAEFKVVTKKASEQLTDADWEGTTAQHCDGTQTMTTHDTVVFLGGKEDFDNTQKSYVIVDLDGSETKYDWSDPVVVDYSGVNAEQITISARDYDTLHGTMKFETGSADNEYTITLTNPTPYENGEHTLGYWYGVAVNYPAGYDKDSNKVYWAKEVPGSDWNAQGFDIRRGDGGYWDGYWYSLAKDINDQGPNGSIERYLAFQNGPTFKITTQWTNATVYDVSTADGVNGKFKFAKTQEDLSKETATGTLANVAAGTTVYVDAKPSAGYKVPEGGLTFKFGDGVNGVTATQVGGSDSTTYTFTMPAQNVSVNAAFEPDKAKFSESVDVTVEGATETGKTGDVLTADVKTKVEPAAVENVTYKWYRADDAVSAGTAIEEATEETYTLAADDIGKYVYVEVTYTGDEYQADKAITSDKIGPVADANVFLDENFESYTVEDWWTNIKDGCLKKDKTDEYWPGIGTKSLGKLVVSKGGDTNDKSDSTSAGIATESSNKYLHMNAANFSTSSRGNRIDFSGLGLPEFSTLDDGKALILTFKARAQGSEAATITGGPTIKAGENGFESNVWADVTLVVDKNKSGYMAVKSNGKTFTTNVSAFDGNTLTTITLYVNGLTLDIDDMKIEIADKPATYESTITVKGSDTADAGLTGATVDICGQSLTTGADGTAKITLPEGTYDYTASKAGYITSDTKTLTVAEAGQNTAEVTLEKESRAKATTLKLVYTTGTDAAGTINADEEITLEDKYAEDTYDVPAKYKGARVISKGDNLYSVYTYESGLDSAVTLQEGETTQYVKVKQLDGDYYEYQDFEKFNVDTNAHGESITNFYSGSNATNIVNGAQGQGNVLRLRGTPNTWTSPIADGITGKVEISYRMHFGWVSGKDNTTALQTSSGEEIVSFKYDSGACKIVSLKIGGVEKLDTSANGTVEEGEYLEGMQDGNAFSGNSASKKAVITITVDNESTGSETATVKIERDGSQVGSYTDSISSLTNHNVKVWNFVNNINNDNNCSTLDDFAVKKISE